MLEGTYFMISEHLVWCYWLYLRVRYGGFCCCHSINWRNFQRLWRLDAEGGELVVQAFNIC